MQRNGSTSKKKNSMKPICKNSEGGLDIDWNYLSSIDKMPRKKKKREKKRFNKEYSQSMDNVFNKIAAENNMSIEEYFEKKKKG